MRFAIIPARGGSVRIPRKNIKPFRGKPMLQWAIEAAKISCLFDAIFVSTDDGEILELARALRCEIHRRAYDDGVKGTQEIARDVIEPSGFSPFDQACVIYPCSPLLHPLDLKCSLTMLKCDAPFVVSVDQNYKDAGCFYWGAAIEFWRRTSLDKALEYQLQPERCIDINTPEDWARAEQMWDALHV